MKKIKRTKAEMLLIWLIVFASIHFVDHILRTDHSGWPFTSTISPLTFILPSIYTLFAITWFNRSRPNVRVVSVGLIMIATLLSHILVEPPQQIYGMWAHNHSEASIAYPGNPDISNAFSVESPLLGAASVIVMLTLVYLSVATFVAFYKASKKSTK